MAVSTLQFLISPTHVSIHLKSNISFSIAGMSNIVDFVSPNAPDLPSKEQVKMLCTKQGGRDNHFIHTHNGEKLFIKYKVPRCE